MTMKHLRYMIEGSDYDQGKRKGMGFCGLESDLTFYIFTDRHVIWLQHYRCPSLRLLISHG